MTKLNLKKQQVELLRIEKRVENLAREHANGKTLQFSHIAGVMAAISALTSTAAAKMNVGIPIEQAAALNDKIATAESPAHALNAIYEALISGHAVIENMAVQAGHILLPNASGVPKRSVESLQEVSRLLGML